MAFANQQAASYNDTVVRHFAIMTVVWGGVGLLAALVQIHFRPQRILSVVRR